MFGERATMKRKEKMRSPKRTLVRLLIALGVLVALFVTLSLLKLNTRVCEFFATTFSRWWIFLFGNALGWIPISLYEIFLIAVILGGIAFVVAEIVLLCKRKWRRFLTALLIAAICVFSFLNVYTSTASFAYNREPLPKEVYEEYSGEDLTVNEATAIAKYIITQANADYLATEHDAEGNIVYPYDFGTLSERMAEEYKRLESDYFSSYTPKGKRIINKTIMSELGISGVFFAPFGEANINGIETGLFLPHTLGHEMAHGKGVMREYEADLVSSYICLTSDDPYIRYGAMVQCIYRSIYMVALYPNTLGTVDELYGMIDPGIITEQRNNSAKWAQYDALDKIGAFFNDLYLKLNGQTGTDSYNKPGDNVDTGEVDDDGQAIVQVINFSDMQNLLITLYKHGQLKGLQP